MLPLFIGFLAQLFEILFSIIHLQQLVLVHVLECVVGFIVVLIVHLLVHRHHLKVLVVQLGLLLCHQLAVHHILLFAIVVVHFCNAL
jgi:hypothetical protein